LKIDLNLLAVELLAAQELGPRARRIARAVSEALPGTFVNLYTVGRFAGEEAWILRAWAGGESVGTGHVPLREGTLGELGAEHRVLLFSGADLSREDYAHLDIRRTLRSLAYVALETDGAITGAIEILSFDVAVSEEKPGGGGRAREDQRRCAGGGAVLRNRKKRFAGFGDAADAALRPGTIVFLDRSRWTNCCRSSEQSSRGDGVCGDKPVAAARRRKPGAAPSSRDGIRRLRSGDSRSRAKESRGTFPTRAKRC
jgi:hypothetical protein